MDPESFIPRMIIGPAELRTIFLLQFPDAGLSFGPGIRLDPDLLAASLQATGLWQVDR